LGNEALEGMTSLAAAAVLFTVCLWLIHNADVQRWKNLIRRHAQDALGSGGKWAVALTAFLAVYREAFETVLFYQALWLRAGSDHTGIVAGFGLGAIGFAVVYLMLFYFGMRLPLKPFFAATSAMLALLAFTFAGYGVRAMQIIGWIPETMLPWNLRLPLLEIYPTVESSALQLGILLSLILGYGMAWYESRIIGRKLQSQPA
jgi:high-affinity iron transporter